MFSQESASLNGDHKACQGQRDDPVPELFGLVRTFLGQFFMPKSLWKSFIWEMLSKECNTEKHHEYQTPKQWCGAIECEKPLNFLKQVT